jgi:ATP-dependent DNA helicase RecG
MRKLNLQDPVITQTATAVMVVLRHERLASLEDRIMDHLRRNPHLPLNNAKAREICKEVSDSKVRKAFGRMMSADMIEKVPGTSGSGTKYRLRIRGDAGGD